MMHDHWFVQACGKEALQFLAEPPSLIPVQYRKSPFQLESVWNYLSANAITKIFIYCSGSGLSILNAHFLMDDHH